MRIETIRARSPLWAEFVGAHPDATPFHLPQWSSVIADCYGFDSFVLAALGKGGELLAGIPIIPVRPPFGARRWVSLPFTDSCALLARSGVDTAEVAQAYQRFLDKSGIRECVVRSPLPELPGLHPVTVGYQHTIGLPDDPSALRIRKSMRNLRNRAQRDGITVTLGESAADVEAYYRLHALTRQRLGIPVQPRRFFQLIAEGLIAEGHGFVAHALLDGEILASGIYLKHNRVVVAKFGASHPDHRDQGAGVLLDWEVALQSCAEGHTILDLGRTDLDAEGLRRYKNGLGAQEAPLVYTHLSERAPKQQAGTASGDRFSRWAIKRSPLWVCRAAGELLYRWVA